MSYSRSRSRTAAHGAGTGASGASHPFSNLEDFLAGKQTPVFFGSAINNFGVREILNALIDWAPAPQHRDATSARCGSRMKEKFSGFVFKIQANMDPKHRDRIAFLRVCSGKFRARHEDEASAPRTATSPPTSVVTFMASHDREHRRGSLCRRHHRRARITAISRSATASAKARELAFTGIPYFAPELFRTVRIKQPAQDQAAAKGPAAAR